jgi:hypothetical protein
MLELLLRNQIIKQRPALLTDCTFDNCGNIGQTFYRTAAIYVKNNGLGGGLGAFSNHWHIQGCEASLNTGRFVYSDYNASYPNPNMFFSIMGCEFEGKYEAIYGTLGYSRIIGNYFAGLSYQSYDLIHLIGSNQKGQGNRIIGNDFRTPGGYQIYTVNAFDVIEGNMFFGAAQSAHIRLHSGSYRCRVLGNNSWDASAKNLVSDVGNENTILFNFG